MTTTTITTLSDNEMREDLSRYVERQIRRTKGIIKGSMENLAEDFNENFMWDPEKSTKETADWSFERDQSTAQ